MTDTELLPCFCSGWAGHAQACPAYYREAVKALDESEKRMFQCAKAWEAEADKLRAELSRAAEDKRKAMETYKRIAERNHRANMMPCPNCGYVQAEIK